jgi:signal transduction histidine kinase
MFPMTEPFSVGRRVPVSHWFWVSLGLCVLAAIGLVQFRWIDEVANAQREHAVAALHASVGRFASEFDTEITRAHFAFQFAAPEQKSNAAAALQDRRRKWQEFAPYPSLVSEVKLVDSAGIPKFLQFRTTPPLPGVAPPPPGHVMHSRAAVSPGPTLTAVGPEMGLVDMPDGRSVAMKIPLTLGGAVRVDQNGGRVKGGVAAAPAGAVQVVFDMNYIEHRFIPELVDRAFAEQKADLQILIASNEDANRVIWSSGPDSSAARRLADFSAPFFAVRPGCLMDVRGQRAASVNAAPAGIPLGAGVIRVGAAGVDPMADGVVRQVLSQRGTLCDQQPPGFKPVGNWKIFVRYKVGSVDAAIGRFRSWSLGLSLGILLLLFLAALMLVISTERARGLATQQMEFAATVSHELHTPLSVIRVAADNLSQGIVETLPQAQRYGSLIAAQVQHLTSLVSDVLMFSRSQACSEIPGMEAVGVEAVVDDALSNCAVDIQAAGFEVERKLCLPLPDIRASRHLITQCLVNIIQNAIKYSHNGKFVGVRAGARDSGSVPGVEFEITDRGPGIPRDELSRVFEPFYRGREARSSQTSGLGLGLTIVKRIVDGHRGRIEVISGPDLHTRFRIWIPAAGGEDGVVR